MRNSTDNTFFSEFGLALKDECSASLGVEDIEDPVVRVLSAG